MHIATETPDANQGATLFARIPQALSESERRQKYDEPITQALKLQNLDLSLRGLTLPQNNDGAHGVAIEVKAESAMTLALVVQFIADCGAPPQTVIEIESDKGTLEASLAELSSS